MTNPITVYIDGLCPLCVAGANRLAELDTTDAVRFVNMHEPGWAALAAARFSPGDLDRQMRVQMPDGSWRSGYFAWAAILERLPLLGWLGRLMQVPLFYGVGPGVYHWVAGHRQGISRALRLPPPCDERGVCRLRKSLP